MGEVKTGPDGGIELPSGRWGVQPEVNRQRRGHDFYPPFEQLAEIPALYATENTPTADKIVHLHYFVGACDWYICELDPTEGLAFGWARLGDPMNGEWGYIHLTELEELNSGLLVVERDLYFAPKRAADALPPEARL